MESFQEDLQAELSRDKTSQAEGPEKVLEQDALLPAAKGRSQKKMQL